MARKLTVAVLMALVVLGVWLVWFAPANPYVVLNWGLRLLASHPGGGYLWVMLDEIPGAAMANPWLGAGECRQAQLVASVSGSTAGDAATIPIHWTATVTDMSGSRQVEGATVSPSSGTISLRLSDESNAAYAPLTVCGISSSGNYKIKVEAWADYKGTDELLAAWFGPGRPHSVVYHTIAAVANAASAEASYEANFHGVLPPVYSPVSSDVGESSITVTTGTLTLTETQTSTVATTVVTTVVTSTVTSAYQLQVAPTSPIQVVISVLRGVGYASIIFGSVGLGAVAVGAWGKPTKFW